MINKMYFRFLPNFLTTIRILITPICVYIILSDFNFKVLALALFLIASITDFFDGYFARKYNFTSKIGAFLDPLADKILVIGIFSSFFILGHIVDIFILLLIIFRDIFVTLLRILMESKGVTMFTSKISKLKTTFQFIIIIILFLSFIFPNFNKDFIYYIALFISILTFYTGIDYLKSNFYKLKLLVANDS